MDVFDPAAGGPRIASGGTFSGNPVSMAAGLAAMTAMDAAAFERLEMLGDGCGRGLTEVSGPARVLGAVTGDGSLFRFVLTDRPLQNYRDTVDPPPRSACTGSSTRLPGRWRPRQHQRPRLPVHADGRARDSGGDGSRGTRLANGG